VNKNTIVDFGLRALRQLLNDQQGTESKAPLGPVKLEDVKLDDLKREKVRLDQEERKLLSDIRDIESQKQKLFQDGVQNVSQREQIVLARRIKELDVQAANMDRMLQSISKQTRTLNGLVQIKERFRLNTESGLASMLTNLDLSELVTYIDTASVDGEFHMTKLDDILRAMEQAEAVSPQYSEDNDVLEIVKQMQMARETGEIAGILDTHLDETAEQLDNKKYSNDEG
jgi:hypothetical protein